ncbi:MAG: hypothetical protein IPG64_22325 [Haliea sp.]|nr:hypothetical protein [Haliea sp.]
MTVEHAGTERVLSEAAAVELLTYLVSAAGTQIEETAEYARSDREAYMARVQEICIAVADCLLALNAST